MNATTLVDLLLELNVINVKDIDNEINKLAAGIRDPRAAKWFRRVPRFFLINIDRLLKEPVVAKAEPRGELAGKYYADPRGGWVKGRGPKPGATVPEVVNAYFGGVREAYDPEAQTYTTSLHEPGVQKDIEQSFTPFKPEKAKPKRLHGEPPTKEELPDWSKGPQAKAKEFHHFDPIQTRRRELFSRLRQLANYLNFQSGLIRRHEASKITPPLEPDDTLPANAAEAEKLMRTLETMKTDDVHGFRNVMKEATDFTDRVKEQPWLFTKDGQLIARHGNLTLRKVVTPETASLFSSRGQPVQTRSGPSRDGNGYMPVWCTKSEDTARNTYLNGRNAGPLYFVDKDNRPYVLGHWPSGQIYGVHDTALTPQQVTEIAPLFVDENRFSLEDIEGANEALAAEVNRLRRGR